jgi:tripartite motif-containing protein 71
VEFSNMAHGTCRETPGRRPRRVDGTLSLLALVVLLAIAATVRAGVEDRAGSPSDRARCVTEFRLAGTVPGVETLGLLRPQALAVDHRGTMLIADTGNHRVVVVSPDGRLITEIGGYGWAAGEFDTPVDLAVTPGFYTYVVELGNRRVQRFDVDGDYVDLVIGEGEAGTPVAAAITKTGGILIVDSDSQTVLARSQFSEVLQPIGRFGTGGRGLVRPADVAVGPGREIAVADPGRNSVEVFDEFGAHLYALSVADSLAPDEVEFDPNGVALVGDSAHGRVWAFPPGGGDATASFALREGLRPSGLALDREGRLLVLDREGGRVYVLEMIYGDCPGRR